MKARGIGTHHALLFEAWAHHLEVSGPKIPKVNGVTFFQPACPRPAPGSMTSKVQLMRNLVKIAAPANQPLTSMTYTIYHS